jgi:hypothetical protein
MMEVVRPPKRRFLQKPHGVTSQKAALISDTLLNYALRFEGEERGGTAPRIPNASHSWR